MSGFATDTISYRPWMQNVTPAFTPAFGLISGGNYTPSVYGWGTTSSGSSSSSSSSESLEDYQERVAKENKQKLLTFREYQTNLAQLEVQNKELKVAEEQLEKATKQEDGSVVIEPSMAEYKKLPWWKKTLRAASNMGQGIINLATKFIGMEDGKWDPIKCLKNVGIAVGAIAACAIPVVGPVIGAGLLATGVISGGVAVVRGINKANKAETLQELDNAYQDIGAGAFIGVSSALGVRGLGKGFRLNNPNGNIFTNTGRPSTAASRSSVLGKTWQSVSQFIRDTFVNSFKSVKDTARMQKLEMGLYKNHLITQKYGATDVSTASRWIKTKASWKSFGKMYKSNVSNILPSLGKERFDKAKQNTANNIQKRIDEIGQNPVDKLQQRELKFLEAQLRELNSSATKNQWMNAKKSSKAHQEAKKLQEAMSKLRSKGKVKINGKELKNTNPDDVKALQAMINQAKGYAKEMKTLSDLRIKTMRWMAMKPKQNKAELEAYAGSSKTSAGYLWDINKGTLTWKTPFKMIWDVTCLPFKPWEYMSKTPAGTLYKLEQGFLPVYEKNMFVDMFGMMGLDLGATTTLTKDEYTALEKSYAETRAQLDQNKALNKNKLKSLNA